MLHIITLEAAETGVTGAMGGRVPFAFYVRSARVLQAHTTTVMLQVQLGRCHGDVLPGGFGDFDHIVGRQTNGGLTMRMAHGGLSVYGETVQHPRGTRLGVVVGNAGMEEVWVTVMFDLVRLEEETRAAVPDPWEVAAAQPMERGIPGEFARMEAIAAGVEPA